MPSITFRREAEGGSPGRRRQKPGNADLCIFKEIPERRLLTIISLLLTPLFVAFATPFIRPDIAMEAIAMQDLLHSTGPFSCFCLFGTA